MRFRTNMALCYLRKHSFPPYPTPRIAREKNIRSFSKIDHIPSCDKNPPQTKENILFSENAWV